MGHLRKLYLCVTLGLCWTMGQSKPNEKIILRNGTELEGYISIQYPGEKLVFMSEKSMVNIVSAEVDSIVNHDYELSTLSAEWQNWADENPNSIKRLEGKTYLTLSNIFLHDTVLNDDTIALDKDSLSLSERSRCNVRVLEKGSTIKYLDFSETSYDVVWDDILTIKRYQRSMLDLTGIVDIVELNSGKIIEGQIVEQHPGRQIRLQGDNGIVDVIDLSQIAVQKKKKLNPNQSLTEQSPMLEVVHTKQGKTITGIIIEQTYNKLQDDYLLIEEKNGKITKEISSNVTEIHKVPNPDYQLLTDIIVKDDEVWINRQLGSEAIIDVEDEFMTIVEEESIPIVVDIESSNDTLIVEQKDNNETRDIILLELNAKEAKKNKVNYVFTYEDLVTRSSRPLKVEVSNNKTLKLLYLIKEGHYVLYKPQNKSAIYLIVRLKSNINNL